MITVAAGAPAPDPLGALVRRLDAWISPLETALNFIAALCILALMFLGVAQIVGRSMLKMPIWGYIDMVELSMAVFAFLGISYCQRLGGHVRMELGLTRLAPRPQYLLEAAMAAFSLFVVLVLTWYGAEHAVRAWESGDSTIDAQFAVWPSKAVVPLALGVLALRLLANTLGYLRLAGDPGRMPIGVPVIEDVEAQARREAEEAHVTDERAAAKGSR